MMLEVANQHEKASENGKKGKFDALCPSRAAEKLAKHVSKHHFGYCDESDKRLNLRYKRVRGQRREKQTKTKDKRTVPVSARG